MATLWGRMLRRLFLGLVLGLVLGGLVAAGLVVGLKVAVFAPDAGGVLLAYLAAIVTGALTGLVAGKPIWASGAKVEAGLKAFFGALLAAGAMFALRQWASAWTPDLSFLGAAGGPDAVGNLPAVSLPLIAAVLGGFFELDNTGGDAKVEGADDAAGARKRIAAPGTNGKAKARLASGEEGEVDDEAPAGKRAKR